MIVKPGFYVVATPIGNLEDITYRAVELLKSVHFVLAEDTRVTHKLFNRYSINTQLVSYRDQNHERMIGKIVEKLDMGLSLALVSDSGTPLISDPGFKLLAHLKQKQYPIFTIPGPSAVIAALSVSGLPTDRFTFLGFLPKSEQQRIDLLTLYGKEAVTLLLYESPNRIDQLLKQIHTALGNRVVSVANNLTKLDENVETDLVENLIVNFQGRSGKGEFVVMVSKEGYSPKSA